MRYKLKGGIHPSENKEVTRGKAIQIINPPELIAIPLQQHIGALLEPLVKVGELIKKEACANGNNHHFDDAKLQTAIVNFVDMSVG